MNNGRHRAPLSGLVAGQRVWHHKFRGGTVLAAHGSGYAERAEVDFGRFGVRTLAVAVARLADGPSDTDVAAQWDVPISLAVGRSTKLDKPPRRVLDPTFEPPDHAEWLRRPDAAAWLQVVGARRAAHLRAVAERLLTRGADAAPMRCEVLAPLFRGEGVVPVQLPAVLSGLDDAAACADGVRWKRVSQRGTRGWVTAVDGTPWVRGRREVCYPKPFYDLRAWAASSADLRFRLTPRSAAALLSYAEQIEEVQGLGLQPALWLARPTGWLHGEARALVQLLFSRALRALVHHVHRAQAVTLDLLRPIDAQLPMAPPETMNAALLLSQRVEQLAQRRGVRWTQARLVMSDKYADCYPDDLWSRITLETHTPFCRVDAWMNDAYDAAGHCWVPIRHWPDANDTVRGAFGELVWFEPDGLFRHWRRNARRGARD